MSASLLTPNYNLPYYNTGDALNFTDYNNAMLKIDTAMEENKATGDNQAGQLSELTTQVTNNTSNITQQNSIIADHTKNLIDLQTQQNNIEHHVEDLETEVNGNSTAIENLQNMSTSQDGKIQTLQENVQKNSTDIADNTEKINQTSALVANQGTIISGMQQSIGNLTTSVTSLETETNELSGDIASVQADVAQAKSIATNAQTQINEIGKEISANITVSGTGENAVINVSFNCDNDLAYIVITMQSEGGPGSSKEYNVTLIVDSDETPVPMTLVDGFTDNGITYPITLSGIAKLGQRGTTGFLHYNGAHPYNPTQLTIKAYRLGKWA